MEKPQVQIEHRWWDDSARWQVVFRTHEGKDYCRETKPATWTREQVEQFVREACAEHNLAGARIERF